MAHMSDAKTYGLMAVALAIGALGIGLAWMFYGRGPSPSVNKLVDGPLAGAYEASKNKLWVDEIYDAVIVRPFKVLAKGLYEVVDKLIIDTIAVNGTAMVVGRACRLAFRHRHPGFIRIAASTLIGGPRDR